MSDYPGDINETISTMLPSTPSRPDEKVEHEPFDRIGQFSGNLLEKGDSFIYAIVGACFFLAAIIALGYCFWNFWNTIAQLPAQQASSQAGYIADAIVAIISDLLLVLIIMEVMSTVIHYPEVTLNFVAPISFYWHRIRGARHPVYWRPSLGKYEYEYC